MSFIGDFFTAIGELFGGGGSEEATAPAPAPAPTPIPPTPKREDAAEKAEGEMLRRRKQSLLRGANTRVTGATGAAVSEDFLGTRSLLGE
jgi:hypothetical protein